LPRKVVQVGTAKVGERRPAATDLEPRRAQQQLVQFSRRGIPLRTVRAGDRLSAGGIDLYEQLILKKYDF